VNALPGVFCILVNQIIAPMKKYLLSCLLILVSCFSYAQDKQAIIKVLETQRQAWNRGDIDGFMQSYWKSDSLMFIGKAAPTYGWQPTLDHYKQSYPDKATMGYLDFNILKVNVLDKTNAFVLGGWHLKRDKGDVGGYFTLWFKKIEGRWVIVCDHTS
jgi:ketosteroid isomerase-like protein